MARSSNGTTDRINFGDIAELDNVTLLSVAGWIKPTSVAISPMIISKKGAYGVDDNGWTIQQGAGGDDIVVVIANAGHHYGSTTVDLLVAGAWAHIGFVYDGGGAANADRLKIYIAGVSRAVTFSGTIPASIAANAHALNMGDCINRGSDPAYAGDLAEFACWPGVALNANEMLTLARGESPARVRKKSQVGHWSLWGLHSPEIDLSGYGYTGTLTGTARANHAPVTGWAPPWASTVPATSVAGAGKPWLHYAQMRAA